MIARHRGDLRAHSRWRPSTPAAPPPAPTATEDEALSSASSPRNSSASSTTSICHGAVGASRAP